MPGSGFSEFFPILESPNLAGALRFYADLLDGEIDYRFPEDGEPEFVSLRIGGAQLGIASNPKTEAGREGQRVAFWIYAESCDAAVERLRAAGVTVAEEPADQPFGERIARVLDPDGNEVIIGQRGQAEASA